MEFYRIFRGTTGQIEDYLKKGYFVQKVLKVEPSGIRNIDLFTVILYANSKVKNHLY